MSYTISLKGEWIRKEALAAGTITPGHLIYLTSAGAVAVHATAGGNCQKAFAIEDDLQGNDIADNYTVGKVVQYNIYQRGAEVYALLKNGENVAIGDALESAGDGTLQKHIPDAESLGADSSANLTTIYTNQIVGFAKTAVDMSGSSGADPSGRIVVEIA